MAATKTLDLKGLEHTERERVLFAALERLPVGEALRVVLEFNPLPLVHMLKAKGEFDIAPVTEGPEQWVLQVTRISAPSGSTGRDTRAELKAVLEELRAGGLTAETKERAKRLLASVDATTLGLVEQELIRSGVSREEIRRSLCDVHLEALRDSLVAQRIEPPPLHPVHTLMEEHKVILSSLQELAALVERLKGRNSFEELGPDLEKLKEISHHLVDAESHHQREEEALFPRLKRHDIVEPAEIMEEDHVEFRGRKRELYQLAHDPQQYDFATFKARVIELGQFIAKELDSHIFKEDNILYQIALQVLSEEEWAEIKGICDRIGYCCFAPADQQTQS